MSSLETFAERIDKINEIIGTSVSIMIIPLALLVVCEVMMRYLFNSPTLWIWDLNLQIAGLICIFGGAYGLLYGSHVSIDIVVQRFSRPRRLLLKLLGSLFFFFAVVILIWKGTTQAVHSVIIREHYTSLWEPPLYPLRMTVPIGAFLLLLQGLSNFCKDLIKFMASLRLERK